MPGFTVVECDCRGTVRDGGDTHDAKDNDPPFREAIRVKIPTGRGIEPSGEAIIDLGYAWGLHNASGMVTNHLPEGMRRAPLDRYRSLGGEQRWG